MAQSGGVIVEYLGTNFSITIGGLRLRLSFALEEAEERAAPPRPVPHKVRVVPFETHAHRN